MSPSMPPPASPSIPIDPALALYPPYYSYPQQQHAHNHVPQHLVIPPQYSSPSSQGSDSVDTPPDVSYSTNSNGKRVASNLGEDGRKKARKEEEDEAQSPVTEKDETKPKSTRGSRACTVCRRLKMKCVGAEHGPPCKRCLNGGHECIFEESNRGKRSSTTKKHELLTRSLRKMEKTLDTVLRSIGNPSIASGMISRSVSPSTQTATTRALLASPSPSPRASTSTIPLQPTASHQPPGSPKLHSLPDNSLNPLGLLAEASLANRRAQANYPSSLVGRSSDPAENPLLGVASDNYFKPGPMTILPLRRLFIERQVQPEMLSFVNTEEVVDLFNIYFDRMNMHCSLLDRKFHTPSLVCSRSPFLLTTMCAIASKFYTAKPDLHLRLTELAKKLAFSVPAQGYKSIEIVQGYLLLSLWGCGAVERYEQDKTWMLLGMAIRMATDLNLHRKTAVTSQDTPEGKARDIEVHNRERTWILCFCLDRSFSAQMGKPHSIKEDYIIRHAADWASSPNAVPADGCLFSYVELQRIISRSLDFLYSGTNTASGLQTSIDYPLIISTMESQVIAWQHECFTRLANVKFENEDIMAYMQLIVQFYTHYAILVLNSFGLQNALEQSSIDLAHFFARCHSSAISCATLVRDQLGPRQFLKYSPDSHFVQTSYAVLSLLKLVRPEFHTFLDHEHSTITLVKDIADILENAAANQHHTPSLYASFLRALISAKLDPQTSTQHRENLSHETHQPEASSFDRGIGEMPPPNHYQAQRQTSSSHTLHDPTFGAANTFQFDSEMGPVADMSTFPPTMVQNPSESDLGMTSLDSILGNGFWDSMLVPGYSNTMEGLSGGFVFGAGGIGSGLITPRLGVSPLQSGTNTPIHNIHHHNELTQHSINTAFDDKKDANHITSS